MKTRLLAFTLLAPLLAGGCREGQIAMATAKIENAKPVSCGRFDLQLPQTAHLNQQTQTLDGIDLSLEPASAGQTLGGVMDARRQQLLAKPRSPIVRAYKWSADSGGVLYLLDISNPDYYALEGRRLLGNAVFVAGTDGDKAKTDLMVQLISTALANFHPGESAQGRPNTFSMENGYLEQAFRNQEDLAAVFIIPENGAALSLETHVFKVPKKLDVVERVEKGIGEAGEMFQLKFQVLHKGPRQVAGQVGQEIVVTHVENGIPQFDANLQTAGEALSPLKPQILLHLSTTGVVGGPPSHRLSRDEFLALWSGIVDSIRARQ